MGDMQPDKMNISIKNSKRDLLCAATSHDSWSYCRTSMDITGFLFVILLGVIVTGISYALDHVWAAVLPIRIIYYIIRLPGVVLHECSHMLGCLLTGAGIQKVVLFSREGGSVTYTRPLIPYIGDVIISTAPLFCLPLVLSLITWAFGTYLGCTFPVFPESVDSPGTILLLVENIIDTFSLNLVEQFNGWFMIYIYLTLSLVLSLAPSSQDIKNAAIGIFLLMLGGIMVIWSGIPQAISILDEVARLIEIGFTLGLVYGIIALVISLPLIFWYAYTRR